MPYKVLIDTNILVYAYEKQDPKRQAKALETLSGLQASASGYMSVKTLSEFFVVVRRIPNPLSTQDAMLELQKHAQVWEILNLTTSIVIEAARGVRDYGFSYWDSQMWATAKIHQINAIFTEDMNVGSVIEGLSIVNPLMDTFDLQIWLAAE